MRYPIAIEMGNETTAFGVIVPDLAGCFSAGDTLDEAIDNAKEAITLHIDGLLDDNENIPAPSPVSKYSSLAEYAGFIWALVEIDPAILDDKAERVNITLPRRVLARLDAKAKEAGETRSGYIARLSIGA
ncbi:MAG: phage-like protein [Sulfuricurvum sp. MLSB]|uniref:type II toxin-antitoxin system HicB family antitoxin n=1 Tax=unclassified Sulfuricurvum TaxID=2632390 RepID=UPI000500167D|nr:MULTISPECIES: type II toxin-antitoxin system HicB family antitoxin [unclassified Sulfuricurvum]KFN39612.1 MAG: phage-like protein [Sulfuricurvum sp. MLSB]